MERVEACVQNAQKKRFLCCLKIEHVKLFWGEGGGETWRRIIEKEMVVVDKALNELNGLTQDRLNDRSLLVVGKLYNQKAIRFTLKGGTLHSRVELYTPWWNCTLKGGIVHCRVELYTAGWNFTLKVELNTQGGTLHSSF